MDLNFKAKLEMACLIDIDSVMTKALRLQTVLKPKELTFFENSGKIG